MRRTSLLLLGLALVGAVPLVAQDAEDDTRAGQLRQQIEDRFAARVQEELGLTDQQTVRLRETAGSYFAKRRALEAEERRLKQALAAELRPGVAANKETVARLTDQLLDNKVRYTETYRSEVKDMSAFLDPVQRAQFLILRERLLEKVRQAQEDRPLLRRQLRRQQP
ncbi:MAG: Spy/CpxP family protein refolding chaperone [Gemmatimonadales bacterium]